jgi:hypothetical protein
MQSIDMTFVVFGSPASLDGMVMFTSDGPPNAQVWVAVNEEMRLEYFSTSGGWVNEENIFSENPAPDRPCLSLEEYYKYSWGEYPAPTLWVRDWVGSTPGWNGDAWLELPEETPETLTPNGNDAWSVAPSGFKYTGRYQKVGWHFRAPITSPGEKWRKIELSWNDVSIWRD